MNSAATVEPGRMHARELVGGVLLVAGRELGSLFDSGIAAVYSIAFALLANSIFMNEFFLAGTVEMTSFFEMLPLLMAFFLPAISMRSWAEERKQRTVELLLTLPLRPIQAILGKYFATLVLLGIFLASSLPIPIMLIKLGDPDLGLIAAGYLGAFLLGATFLAFGSLMSALSSDQIVAFVTTAVICLLLVLLGDPRVVAVLDGLAPNLALGTTLQDTFSVAPHYGAFVRGVIQLSSTTFFVLASVLFLWLCSSTLRMIRS